MTLVLLQTVSGHIALTLGALLMVALVAMPWWATSGLIRTMVELNCFIAIAQMWNLLAGYAALFSVGMQAFSGAAAYAMFALSINLGANPFLSAALCLIVPAVLAVPTYALLHRLDGPYFSIGT
jgi:branched-chain amino acid transport system permease protein